MDVTFQDWTQIVLVATALLSLLKPLIEAVPGVRPGSKNHDAILRIINFLMCLAGVVVLASQQHTLAGDPGALFGYLTATVQFWTGSQATYHIVVNGGQSVGNSAVAQAIKGTVLQTLSPAPAQQNVTATPNPPFPLPWQSPAIYADPNATNNTATVPSGVQIVANTGTTSTTTAAPADDAGSADAPAQ